MLDPEEPVAVGAAARSERALHHPPSVRAHAAPASRNIRSGRLAGLSMGAAIYTLAWPVLCESMLNAMVGLVDATIASHVSLAAVDAVGAAVYILWFLGLISTAIGTGATALIARSIGAGKTAVARGALGQAMLLSVFGGVIVAVAMLALAPGLAGMFSLSPDASNQFIIYLRTMAAGMPLACVLFAGMACARGAGDTVRPLLAMIVVNVVNLALAWLLAVRMGLGVVGIGAGTATAWSVGGLLILWFHAHGRSGIHLRARWLRPHAVTLYRLVRLGLPNLFETLGMYVVNMMVILMVAHMNARAVVEHAAGATADAGGLLSSHLWAIRIEAFSFLPGFSMGIAAGALCGQYLGAGSPEKARKAALICAGIAMLMMGLLGLVFIFGGGFVMRLLSDQPVHHEVTPQLLYITGLVQVPFALSLVLRSAMHGAGDVKAVMIMTWICQWGLRLPLAYAFSGVDFTLPAWLGGAHFDNPFPFDLGLKGLWIGLCIEICLRTVLYAGRFWHGGWLKARV